jgi:hypothetical protein
MNLKDKTVSYSGPVAREATGFLEELAGLPAGERGGLLIYGVSLCKIR